MTGQSPPERPAAVEEYLAQVASRLPGGAVGHRDFLDEIEHGLCEAVRELADRGVEPVDVAATAVVGFGSPEVVAAAHLAESRVRQVRSGAWGTLGLLLLAGLAWEAYSRLLTDLWVTVPQAGWARQAFLGLTVSMPVLPVVAQLAAAALALVSGRAVAMRTRAQLLLGALSLLLAVTLALTLANALSVFALMSTDMPSAQRWLAPFALLAPLVAAMGSSLVTARSARAARRAARTG